MAGEMGAGIADSFSNVRDMASGAIETAREQAQAGTAALGTAVRNLAGALRQRGPHEGMMGTAAGSLAETLERGGHYLEEEGLNHIVDDMTTLIRNNPLPAIGVSIGLGFMVAHLCRSSR